MISSITTALVNNRESQIFGVKVESYCKRTKYLTIKSILGRVRLSVYGGIFDLGQDHQLLGARSLILFFLSYVDRAEF